MSPSKKLVLDANILLRAVFGNRVYELLKRYEEVAEFYTPDQCVYEARTNLPAIAIRKGTAPHLGLLVLDEILDGMIQVVDQSLYEIQEQEAHARISQRDPDDWPVVATALLLNAPIWTEDQDFFGSGIATWTSDRVEIYLREK
jgi:predicted nucleic acid-binding protein